jgi:DNA-binding CsgD family transcriptional regulator
MRQHGTVNTDLLSLWSLDARDEQVYRLALTRRGFLAEQLAEEAGQPVGVVRESLEALRQHGLVNQAGTGHYGAVDPRYALRALADDHAARLDRFRGGISAFADVFEEARRGANEDRGTRIVRGAAEISDWYYRLNIQATQELLSFDLPPYVLATTTAIEEGSIARGVRWRAVYAAASLEVDGGLERLRANVADGEEARITETLPAKLAIADGVLGLIGLNLSATEPEAIVTESPVLLAALTTLFESQWSRGVPFAATDGAAWRSNARTDPQRPPTVAERELLTLIAGGVKDEAIARQLGMSTRTIRRRIHLLFAELGATNRFHAGVQAAQRGWI